MDHDKLIAYQASVQRADDARRNYLNTSADDVDGLATAHEEYVNALTALNDTNVGQDTAQEPEPAQPPADPVAPSQPSGPLGFLGR